MKNIGKKFLSDLKLHSDYLRWDLEKDRYESWQEAMDTIISQHRTKYKHVDIENELEFIKPYVDNRKVLFSQRNLQFRGNEIFKHNSRLFNCFEENTKFVTKEGVKSFKDFNENDTCIVKTHTGKWKKAVVKKYEEQDLYKISFTKGKNGKAEVYATKNHTWFLKDGSKTTNLKIDDKLYQVPDTFVEFNWDTASVNEQLYWCYGYVYGDGSVGTNGYSRVRLCDNEIKYEYRFLEMGFSSCSPLSIKGDIIVSTGTYKKTTPDPKIDSPELIRAFVHGYLSADGYKNNNPSGKQFNSIQSSQLDHIEFIRNCFPIAGVYILSETNLTGQQTNYGVRPYTINFSIYEGCRNYMDKSWKVSDIKYSHKDIVWCLEVEDDHSFVLHNGMITGNCSVTFIDRTEVFKQIMYLLLSGCGVGFSVENLFISKLPTIKSRKDQTITYIIPDSIEGWSLALDQLMNSYFNGTEKIRFDYSQIRPKDSLIANRFLAPGGEPLKKSLEIIENLLESRLEVVKEHKLSSLEIYDIICHASDAVLSAGLRRSALICLFDKNDSLMINAKTGNWYIEAPQRARSNNSVKLIEGEYTKEEFDFFANKIKEFGEPGFVIVKDKYFLTNPCAEIGFIPINPATGNSCISFCNLCEINATGITTLEELLNRVEAATIIGTLQSGYISFPFLGQDTEQLTAWESLLGVSITGWFDNPKLFNPEWLELAAKHAIEVNEQLAYKLAILPSARITTVKPSGNASVVLGTASGAHADHSKNYFRIMQLNKSSEVSKWLEKNRPEMLEDSVWSANKTDYAIYVPIILSEDAIVKNDLTSIEFLEKIKLIQQHWVLPGTVKVRGYSDRVTHNVSNTVIVDNWEETFNYLYENREYFSGVSFMPKTGDKIYRQAPFTEVLTTKDLLNKYGDASFFVSGLIVDLLHAFNNDLWEACEAIIDPNYFLGGTNLQILMKKDLIRRAKKYSKNYLKNDLDLLISCIKDIHLYHKWHSINRNFKPVDIGSLLTKPKYLNADEMGAIACYGGACNI
jgi:ribonucleoside-diphosphate reductase alpha chain